MATLSIISVSELENADRIDAEYYDPRLRTLAHGLSFASVPLRFLAKWITQGPNPHFTEAGVPCLNGRNISAGRVNVDNPDHISPEEFEELSRYKLYVGDMLVTLKGLGSIGQVALVSKPLKAIFSRDVGLVRQNPSSVFLTEYVFAYLSCKTGRDLLDRGTTGATGQMTLTTTYLGSLPVPAANSDIQNAIAGLVRDSEQQYDLARERYRFAEKSLLDKMGWGQFDLSEPNGWSCNLATCQDNDRLDAEHFRPKWKTLRAEIQKTGMAKTLGEIAPHIHRGVQPDYIEGGDVVVVNSQHLGRYQVDLDGTERTDKTFWEKKKRAHLKKNDALLYSTGAYVGRTNVWLETRKAIASNHVAIIRPDSSCNSLYLSVFLNSPAGRLQAEQWATGSGQRELYPSDLSKFTVYLPPMTFQEEIAAIVEESYLAHRRGRQVLNEAISSAQAVAVETAARGINPASEEEQEQRETWDYLQKLLRKDNPISKKLRR